MNSIFKGDVATARGRALAWVDSLFIDHSILRLLWSNWAAVSPNRLYRSNHPTPQRIRRAYRRYGVRTLINLRGVTQTGSYALSRDAALKLGMEVHDLSLESRGAPHKDRIFRLFDIFAHMRGPGLIHCKSGADRAGLAAGLFVMFEGGTAAAALRQLSLRFGHIKQAKTGILDAFFLRYQREGEGRKPFLDWVRDDYDEAALKRDFHASGLANFIDEKVLHHE